MRPNDISMAPAPTEQLGRDRDPERGRKVELRVLVERRGRQSEALRCFSQARRALVEQLGVDPGSELVREHWRPP